jgi:hypothetical protein
LSEYEEAEDKGVFEKKHLDKVLSHYSDNPLEDISEDDSVQVVSGKLVVLGLGTRNPPLSLLLMTTRKFLRSQRLSQALQIKRD